MRPLTPFHVALFCIAFGLLEVPARSATVVPLLGKQPTHSAFDAQRKRKSVQVTTLYVFQGPPDAGHPNATVTFDDHGSIFGVTSWGGPAGIGAVYRLTPAASGYSETVLHSFAGGRDGSRPYYGLAAGKGGNLYGTASVGGNERCSGGCGVVFEVRRHPSSPNGYLERILYRFVGGMDGSNPSSAPLIAAGTIYGTTQTGGGSTACSGGCGTVFKLTPTGHGYSESILYRFQGGSDGADPIAGLVADTDGALYGTTLVGGGSPSCSGGCGTVFKLTPTSSGYSESVLYRFLGGSDGAILYSGVIVNRRGRVFGTTAWGGYGVGSLCDYNGVLTGCGTVFELRPGHRKYHKTTLYEFTDASDDGAGPWGGVTFGKNGTLYGTTLFGGNCGVAYYGCGTVYELSPASGTYQFTLLYSFPGFAAAFPYAPVLFRNGVLYGTTAQGGVGSCDPTSYACGTVFELTP